MSLLERTLSEIAKPRWEGSPTFGGCWDGLRVVAADLAKPRRVREFACGLFPHLAACRVVVVEANQMAVLPRLDGDVREVAAHLNLPFESVYVDLGGVEARDAGQTAVAGALLSRGIMGDGALWGTLFAWNESRGFGFPFGLVNLESTQAGRSICTTELETGVPISNRDHVVTMGEEMFERVVAALLWMESANVELVDAPLTRQVRRQAERKGHSIARVVRVKLPRSYRPGGTPQQGAVEFSHRFEVRGHYKFFPAETKLASAAPEKLSWVPEREGYFRRIWCPPFVKGPVDKPLVPKTRILQAA